MDKNKKKYIDPVCRMEIEKPVQDDKTLFTANYKGEVFYFCSPFCTAAFLENPERYLNKETTDENNIKGNPA